MRRIALVVLVVSGFATLVAAATAHPDHGAINIEAFPGEGVVATVRVAADSSD